MASMNEQLNEKFSTAEIADESASYSSDQRSPICVIVLGMAGSGKTTFVHRIANYIKSHLQTSPYLINLDPAVLEIPYNANVDIRDTVKYKQVMKEYNLGPNGAIMTSLNLFTTRFDQVMHLLDSRKSETEYVIFDTPGQIEVFTWSASGTIITETLASSYPTIIVYVLDLARSNNPVTFMSNMLYACSILYKTKLPFLVVLNKADIIAPTFALEWIRDWDSFQTALDGESSYSSDLARSMSLVLDEFYQNLKCVGFSALTGEGAEEFIKATVEGRNEYENEYKQEYEKLKKARKDAVAEEQLKQMERIKIDLEQDKQRLQQSETEIFTKNQHKILSNIRKLHLGGGELEEIDDENDEQQCEDDDEEKQEYESFKRFLSSGKTDSH